MADRVAAALFGDLFNMLAEGASHAEIAQKLWKASREFDFGIYQICADDALEKLGLARTIGGHLHYKDRYSDDEWFPRD